MALGNRLLDRGRAIGLAIGLGAEARDVKVPIGKGRRLYVLQNTGQLIPTAIHHIRGGKRRKG